MSEVAKSTYRRLRLSCNAPTGLAPIHPKNCITVRASGTGFIAANGNRHSPRLPQTGRDPVVFVSWDDAQAYVAWLTAKTGMSTAYQRRRNGNTRCARGTTTARYHSDDPAEFFRDSNVGDLDYNMQHPGDRGVNRACRDEYAFTSPVGSFPPNQFGLYDMLGNLMDWTEERWNANYSGAPADGAAWLSGDCGRRVVRGGSGSAVSSAHRRGIHTSEPATTLGFRMARTLDGQRSTSLKVSVAPPTLNIRCVEVLFQEQPGFPILTNACVKPPPAAEVD